MREAAKFAHRKNPIGTVDSICPRCAATVATVYVEGELLIYEQQHICDPVLIERYSGKKPPSSETVRTPISGNSQSSASRDSEPTTNLVDRVTVRCN